MHTRRSANDIVRWQFHSNILYKYTLFTRSHCLLCSRSHACLPCKCCLNAATMTKAAPTKPNPVLMTHPKNASSVGRILRILWRCSIFYLSLTLTLSGRYAFFLFPVKSSVLRAIDLGAPKGTKTSGYIDTETRSIIVFSINKIVLKIYV